MIKKCEGKTLVVESGKKITLNDLAECGNIDVGKGGSLTAPKLKKKW